MTDGWGIKTLQDKVTCFHLKLTDFQTAYNDGPCDFTYSLQKGVGHSLRITRERQTVCSLLKQIGKSI